MSRIHLQKRQAYDWSKFSNQAAQPIFDHGLSSVDDLQVYYPRVRDRSDIGVLRCQKSGVIVLDRSDHMDLAHYSEQDGFSYWGGSHRGQVLERTRRDDMRRAEQFRNLLEGKRCLDVGSGAGGFLDHALPLVKDIAAVEPQAAVRAELQRCGYSVFPSMEHVAQTGLDVVTVFHVLEHMTNPLETLVQIRRRLRPRGQVLVEVPHARDYLLSYLEHEPFKAFTFWSEHLVLHTRDTLRLYLELAGFSKITISGYQRYPLANHIHWLHSNEPGGHERRPELSTRALDATYEQMLDSLDATDTLIAVAEA